MGAPPLKPPARYREEVVDYLHLEFGESREDPDALKADELKYVGLFVSDGVPTYYWAYPVSKGPREYATWSVYANTYCLGMTGTAPDPATRITDPAQCPELATLDVPPPRERPWYRRGPLAAVFGVAAVFVVFWSIVRTIRGMRKTTVELSARPIPELLPEWLEAMDHEANDSRAELLPGASEAQIADTGRRLGRALPPAVAEFYRASNGVRWHNALRNEPLPPLAELRHGRDFDPPLSSRLQRYWEENERESGEPQSLQVTKDDVKGMFNADPLLLDFAAVDGMVAISRPDESNYLVFMAQPVGELPAGTVLDVEGTYATRYADLAHWLAGQVAIFASLHQMRRRLAK